MFTKIAERMIIAAGLLLCLWAIHLTLAPKFKPQTQSERLGMLILATQ